MALRVYIQSTKIFRLKNNADYILRSRRFFSKSSGCLAPIPTRMKAWQINSYGDNDVLEFKNARVPKITQPDQLVVQVHAASINPVDIAMRGGYGRTILPKIKGLSGGSEFPLIPGRDYSGIVMETGKSVRNFKVGDEVWGITSFQHQGSHAEYALVSTKEVARKPKTLSHTEAASVPFVALTAWAAIVTFGNMTEKKARGKRILVHAGSGGIGSFAIQLLRSWGAEVVTTCSTDAIPLVTSLGADYAIDYTTQNVIQELKDIGEFDMVVDTLGGTTQQHSMEILKKWSNANYVTVVSSLLKDTDQYGLVPGLASAGLSMATNTIKGLASGQIYQWAFCIPNSKALNTVGDMIDRQHIHPVIDQVFPFDQLPDAFAKLEGGGARGKTVVEIIQDIQDKEPTDDE
ncbi:NAD(P)H oxidoreductase RTN4IP1, mitochondrial-like [Glandiceps talaboti]